MTGSLHRTLFVLGQENPDVGINDQAALLENFGTDAFSKDLTGLTSPYALTTVNPGAEAYNFYVYTFTGALTSDFTIEVPVDKRPYKVVNSTTGGHNIIFKTVAGTGITIAASAGAAVYCDGTNVVNDVVSSSASAITALTGDVTATGPGSVAATIAASAVTNAKMANMAGHSYKGNNTGSSAAPSDLTATQLTAELNEMVGDSGSGVTKGLVPAASTGSASTEFLRKDGTWAVPAGTSLELTDGTTDLTGVTKITVSGGTVGGTSAAATLSVTPGSGGTVTPQGRLTLQSGAPVMTADQTAKGTIYYDTDVTGNICPVWNGSSFDMLAITGDEISLILDATNHTSGKLFDVFGIKSSGALVLVTGPDWTQGTSGSLTARGTGAGSTELQYKSGLLTNKNALTHAYNNSTDYGSIAANEATYLGTFYTTANGQTGCAFNPSPASGGTNNIIGLDNAYNRKPVDIICTENVGNYSYNVTTWRALNNSNSNRITKVCGLVRDSWLASANAFISESSGAGGWAFGIDLDSTSATPNLEAQLGGGGVNGSFGVDGLFGPLLGLHYIQLMEWGSGGSSAPIIYSAPQAGFHSLWLRLHTSM